MMQIDRVLYPITTLGPGKRLVIWTIGCKKECPKCANPELWRKDAGKSIDVTDFVDMLKQSIGSQPIDGVTLTGGDPLEQPQELAKLLPLLRKYTDDILIYTGYILEEAINASTKEEWDVIKQHTSVLIDGPYIDGLNNSKCALRGSANQNIRFFDENKKELYNSYLRNGPSIQNVFYAGKMISVGIHRRE